MDPQPGRGGQVLVRYVQGRKGIQVLLVAIFEIVLLVFDVFEFKVVDCRA